MDVGSANPTLNRNHVHPIKVPWPPLEEQRQIAELLGSIDDKIELHCRMNETLEAMARALFKDWFVDFGPTRAKVEGRSPYLAPEFWSLFPEVFNNDDKPVEWRETNLSTLTSKIGSGATPRGGNAVYVNEGIHFIRSQNIYDYRFVWDGLVKICEEDAERLRGVTVETDDILLNITGDSILRTCIVDPGVLPARVNQHVAIIRARENIPSRFLHLYLVQPSSKALLLGNDAGGSRPAVTKGHLEAFSILLPTQPILNAFREITASWFDHISHNEAENRILAQLRDLLLPRLMSGAIRLRDAEKLAEERL